MSSKAAQQRNERTLNELRTLVHGNNACADCGASQPRWASWNIGIFLCVRCAQLHRSLGTHISKVKSLTLDTWTKEQIDSMRQNGNVKSNAFYNPDPRAHPPPLDFESEGRDSELLYYVQQKYRDRAFVAVQPKRPHTPMDSNSDSPPSAQTSSGSVVATRSSSSATRHEEASENAVRQLAPSPPNLPTSAFASSDLAPAATLQVSRAMTAPILPVARSVSPSQVRNPYNPFNRAMTASVQIPVTTTAPPEIQQQPGSFIGGYGVPFQPVSAFGQAMAMAGPYQAPRQHFAPQINGPVFSPTSQQSGVWSDLAGLSFSSQPSLMPYPAVAPAVNPQSQASALQHFVPQAQNILGAQGTPSAAAAYLNPAAHTGFMQQAIPYPGPPQIPHTAHNYNNHNPFR